MQRIVEYLSSTAYYCSLPTMVQKSWKLLYRFYLAHATNLYAYDDALVMFEKLFEMSMFMGSDTQAVEIHTCVCTYVLEKSTTEYYKWQKRRKKI